MQEEITRACINIIVIRNSDAIAARGGSGHGYG